MTKSFPTTLHLLLAHPERFRLTPMPESHVNTQIHFPVTEKEMDNVRLGWMPEDMSDRWFIYVDENDVAHMHRSWTGFCVFKVQFEYLQEGWAATRMTASRNPDEYKNIDIERDKEYVKELIFHLLAINRKQELI